MLYPLKFEPLYKEYIWGGRNMASLGKELPEGKVAESWEIACHRDGESIVSNGFYKGKLLSRLIKEQNESLLGKAVCEKYGDRFPVLIKIIDANDKLSVQVHPDDEYAFENEGGDFGKSEMWYVLDAKPGAKLVYGVTADTGAEEFVKSMESGSLEEFLNNVDVVSGDFFDVPAGLVHAIDEGILIFEIQQNSNSTYRVYDYDRRDKKGNRRPLHVKKALDVIDFNNCGIDVNSKKNDLAETSGLLGKNEYFTVEKIKVTGDLIEKTDGESFIIYYCIDSEAVIDYVIDKLPIKMGETVLLPAMIGDYTISGSVNLIKVYMNS